MHHFPSQQLQFFQTTSPNPQPHPFAKLQVRLICLLQLLLRGRLYNFQHLILFSDQAFQNPRARVDGLLFIWLFLRIYFVCFIFLWACSFTVLSLKLPHGPLCIKHNEPEEFRVTTLFNRRTYTNVYYNLQSVYFENNLMTFVVTFCLRPLTKNDLCTSAVVELPVIYFPKEQGCLS